MNILALKYARQDMRCLFHPKIIRCHLSASCEHWEHREIKAMRCKCLMETQENCWGEEGMAWRCYGSSSWSPTAHACGSLAGDTRSTSARHLHPRAPGPGLPLDPPTCFSFILHLPRHNAAWSFAICCINWTISVERTLWKQRLVWCGVGNVCAKKCIF